MLSLVATAVERAMKLLEVILRALSGALTWVQAADILGIDPRSLRRWRARYEADQQLGLYDRRRLSSPARHPWGWCSSSCACIARPTAGSTCGTFTTCASATTA
jgi:hypothetical protein